MSRVAHTTQSQNPGKGEMHLRGPAHVPQPPLRALVGGRQASRPPRGRHASFPFAGWRHVKMPGPWLPAALLAAGLPLPSIDGRCLTAVANRTPRTRRHHSCPVAELAITCVFVCGINAAPPPWPCPRPAPLLLKLPAPSSQLPAPTQMIRGIRRLAVRARHSTRLARAPLARMAAMVPRRWAHAAAVAPAWRPSSALDE